MQSAGDAVAGGDHEHGFTETAYHDPDIQKEVFLEPWVLNLFSIGLDSKIALHRQRAVQDPLPSRSIVSGNATSESL